MLSNTHYFMKTSVWSNMPVVYRPPPPPSDGDPTNSKDSQFIQVSFDSGGHGDSKMMISEGNKGKKFNDHSSKGLLFSNIRMMTLALKKENLFWKKNFEEFNSINFSEWDLSYTQRLMDMENLSKRLLSKSKDFYNYPKKNPEP